MAALRSKSSETRNLGVILDGVGSKRPAGVVKRWEGFARTCYDWDHLRKDTELWFRNGDCLVYLYAKGHSRRGPSFKVHFRDLLENKCFPLIERFLSTPDQRPKTPKELEQWSRRNSKPIELYIPPPATANKNQAFAYHIATRNFFAWVFRRSVVGESLGRSLVGLLHSMHEFRSETVDNVVDLMEYIDEEGYNQIANQPNHALAMLALAETFRMKELYIHAFSHCVGMGDRIKFSSEYEPTSYKSQKLIRQSQSELKTRLSSAKSMLRNFLDDSLSEAHIGIAAGARAHLERFRSFLLSFYATRLGYYPPRDFTPLLCRTMRRDFEALYNLLADDTYTNSEIMPSVAVGGMCTLQLVQSFDKTHKYEPLAHPLPLLPRFKVDSSVWMPWRSRSEKLRPSQRSLAHASLVKASNWTDSIWNNDLVKAYREFEEESVLFSRSADKKEKVSVVDARKVRWILVYAVYQVLRSITDFPTAIHDAEEASYHVAISTKNLPPWKELEITIPRRRQTDLALESPAIIWRDTPGFQNDSGKIEIKPDIDYFALTHQAPDTSYSSSVPSASPMSLPMRSSSVSRALGRSSTLRRSMRIFRQSTPPGISVTRKPVYHEIVVKGYGNGTNLVNFGPETISAAGSLARGPSTASHSGSTSPPESTNSSDTLDDSIKTPTSTTPMYLPFPEPKPPQQKRLSLQALSRSLSVKPTKRPMSTILSYEELVEQQRKSFYPEPHVADDDWTAMQVFMDAPVAGQRDQWEEYGADLGGLTEMM